MRKSLIFYFIILFITLILMFEVINNATFLFYFFCFVILLGFFLIVFNKKYGKILLIVGFGIFSAWIIYYFIYQYQSEIAYKKIISIPKEQLKSFYRTKDYKYIPDSLIYTWIGIFPQKIKIVERNNIMEINAVGWKGNSVFGYYDIVDDEYITSIK
jgi:hypothetical protein